MKRTIIISFALMAASLLSCNKTEPVTGEQVTVNYRVSVPMTKSFGQGESINYIWYALYRMTDNSLVKDFGVREFVDGTADCPVTMVLDQSYKIVFVGQHYDVGENMTPKYSIDPPTSIVTSPAQAVTSSDDYDIFYTVQEVIEYDGNTTGSVKLERLAAQINFSCTETDWNNAASLDMTPTRSSINISGVPSSYNILQNKLSDNTIEVKYALGEVASRDNLGTVYLLAGDNVQATLCLYHDDIDNPDRTLVVGNVPIKQNHKTNIYGSIMTGVLDYSITLDTDSEIMDYPLE